MKTETMRWDRQQYLMSHGNMYTSMAFGSGKPPLFLTCELSNYICDPIYVRLSVAEAMVGMVVDGGGHQSRRQNQGDG